MKRLDESLLTEMQDAWGQQFQSLNNSERLWMIVKLGEELVAEDGEDISEEVEEAMGRIEELSTRDKLGLIQALISQAIAHGLRFGHF